MNLWNENTEIRFFKEALKNFASPEQIFYKIKSKNLAYIPKKMSSEGQTLQARNSLIGQYTEKWTKEIMTPFAKKLNLFALNDIVCEEIGLTARSTGDLGFCATNDKIQKPENIKIIFEVKMSIVSNYEYLSTGKIVKIGDYKSHQGTPSILRSDSMLKAIGKAINIRVSGTHSANIPIVILGNSPITDSYIEKVDFLKKAGVIQGFWSLNPNPTETDYIEQTPNRGFQTIKKSDSLFDLTKTLVESNMNYFSSMIPKLKLGEIIKVASNEKTDLEKAEKFLNLLRGL